MAGSGGFGVALDKAQVVSRDIRRILTQRAHFFNIVLDDVSITNLTFSRDYTAAVESKQVAQQDAERAKFVVRPPSPTHPPPLTLRLSLRKTCWDVPWPYCRRSK